MLAPALIFIFGALVATLAALLLVPLVWRKAQALARREAQATLPMTLPEMQAEVDAVRARAAMQIRAREIEAASARDTAAAARAEAGRLLARLANRDAPVAAPAIPPRAAEETLAALRDEPPVDQARLQQLNDRLQEMDEDSGERRLLLAAALMRIEQLEAELAPARRGRAAPVADSAPADPRDALRKYGRSGALRNDILTLAKGGDGADAAIRAKLDEIAATVATLAAADAPAGSRLATMLDAPSEGEDAARLGPVVKKAAHPA